MVYVFLAEGFEEIEALTPVDMLRRANIPCKTVGISGKTVVGSHSIPVVCDITISDDIADISAVILPGGMPGTENLKNCEKLISIVKNANSSGKLIAAICAAPSVLGQLGLLAGKTATCFPGFENQLKGAVVSESSVCTDGNIITAKGAGTAIDFAAAIINVLKGNNEGQTVKKAMQCNTK